MGIACLPFIWAVNAIWFFEEAFREPEYEEQKQIRKCKFMKKKPLVFFFNLFTDVIYSAIGALVWLVIVITWVTLFQVNRVNWGEFADDISFIIPVGSP